MAHEDEEFAEEIRSHLAHEADRLRALGMGPADAAAAARRRFGNVTAHQELRILGAPRKLFQLRAGLVLRRSVRNPVFTAAALAMLAGAFAAIALAASLLYATRFRPLPVGDLKSLVTIWTNDDVHAATPQQDVVAYPTLQAWRDQQHVVDGLTSFVPIRVHVQDQWQRRFEAAMVDGQYFSTLQLRLERGRGILPGDDAAGAVPVIVLSHAKWRTDFNSDPAVIGHSWMMNGAAYTVIGVTAPEVDALGTPAWVSSPGREAWQGNAYFHVIARLRPGQSVASVERTLTSEVPRPIDTSANAPRRGALVIPFAKTSHVTTPDSKLAIAATVLLALVALINLGTLFLVRAMARVRQFAISVAIGATTARLRLDAAAEGALLGLVAGCAAIVLARLASVELQDFISAHLTASAELLPIPPALGAAVVAAAVVTGALIAVAAQGAIGLVNVAAHMHGGGSGNARRQSRWRVGLVAAQICAAVLAIVAATRLVASEQFINGINVGFETDHLLVGELPIWDTPLGTDEGAAALVDRLGPTIASHPGLGATAIWATIGFRFPTSPDDRAIDVDGNGENFSRRCRWETCPTGVTAISDNAFAVLGIRLTAGRSFGTEDRGGPPVIIVNEQARQSWFHGIDPIGHRIRILGSDQPDAWRTVVGIVANSAQLDAMGREPAMSRPGSKQPLIYIPIAQARLHQAGMLLAYPLDVAIRPPLARAQTMQAFGSLLAAAVPQIEPPNVMTMTSIFEQGFGEDEVRLHTAVVTTVAAITLVLALVGIGGVVAEGVRQRTRELGIRLALGGSRSSIIALISQTAMRLVLAGATGGIALAALGETTLARLALGGAPPARPRGVALYGPDHTFMSYAVAGGMLVATAMLAALLPAWRASRLDPARVLRSDLD